VLWDHQGEREVALYASNLAENARICNKRNSTQLEWICWRILQKKASRAVKIDITMKLSEPMFGYQPTTKSHENNSKQFPVPEKEYFSLCVLDCRDQYAFPKNPSGAKHQSETLREV
jgi:hypothetical protein